MSQPPSGHVQDILSDLLIGLDHVGIAVADLEVAVMHWQALGFRVTHREDNLEQGVREAMMAAGDSGVQIQLLAAVTDDSPIARFLATSGPGIQQLALRVTDVELAGARVRAAGLRMLYDTARRGTAGSRINFIHPKDCGGVLVELVEQPASH